MRKKDEYGSNRPSSASDNPVNALTKFAEIVEKEYNLDLTDVLSEIRKVVPKDITIPVTIFSEKLSSLESICKYLKENRKLRIQEIAELLNRDYRTIWTTYHNTIRKHKKPVMVARSDISIPVSVFVDRKFSVLEAIVSYLRQEGHSLREIADMLHRDQRNIWTVQNRAKKKWEKGK